MPNATAEVDVSWQRDPNLFLMRAGADLDCALQPIVDINTGRTLAYESLVRQTDRLGFASPESLFEHAHATGVLLELELVIQTKALAKYAGARENGWALLFLNLDGRLLGRRREIEAHLTQLLSAHGMNPSDVCIELSERNQILEAEAFECEVASLRRAGFSVALDDFGTGNSGLQMLYKCNPDFLKIDRFFVSSVQSDPKKRVLVSSIVDLAHALGIRVIAEGIETTAELHSCRRIRCDLAQGYYISRPVIDTAELKTSYGVIGNEQCRRGNGLSADDVRALVEPLMPLSVEASLADVFEIFERNPRQTMIPIIDAGRMPRGIVRERDIKPFIYSRFGRELLRNKALGFGLKNFVCSAVVADINSPFDPLLELSGSDANDAIIVIDQMAYCGVLPTTGLLKLSNDMRTREASNRNPLTRLPGNQAIRAYLDELAERQGLRRLVCYLDVDNFKPFNDKYGFRIGDRALMMLANILKSLQIERDIFVGHIGGDDFFIGGVEEHSAPLLALLPTIRQRFNLEAESLYSPLDREAGVIIGKSRDGRDQAFPLLTCSIAALDLDQHAPGMSAEEVASYLAQIKLRAKSAKTGIAVAQVGANSTASTLALADVA
jgi:diguanylate cyclase (GGDEF)-like protein